jgi:hypothetical protein
MIHLYQLNRSRGFLSFLGRVRFASTQLTPYPPFPLPGGASPPAQIIIPLHRVTLPSHGVKMSSLPLFHLLITLHPVASPLKLK